MICFRQYRYLCINFLLYQLLFGIEKCNLEWHTICFMETVVFSELSTNERNLDNFLTLRRRIYLIQDRETDFLGILANGKREW